MRLAIDPHEDLVQVPASAGIRSVPHEPLADLGGKHRSEAVPPKPHRLVAEVGPRLEQQIFDLPQRQRIANIQHYCEADDLGRTVDVAEGISHPANYGCPICSSIHFCLTPPLILVGCVFVASLVSLSIGGSSGAPAGDAQQTSPAAFLPLFKREAHQFNHRRLAATPEPDTPIEVGRPIACTTVSAMVLATPEKFRKSSSVSLSGHIGSRLRRRNGSAVAKRQTGVRVQIMTLPPPRRHGRQAR